MRICLNLVNEYKRIFFFFHSVACKHTCLQIKVFDCASFGKQSAPGSVLYHIDLYEVWEQQLSDVTDDVCFAYLPCAVDQQDFTRTGF